MVPIAAVGGGHEFLLHVIRGACEQACTANVDNGEGARRPRQTKPSALKNSGTNTTSATRVTLMTALIRGTCYHMASLLCPDARVQRRQRLSGRAFVTCLARSKHSPD
jgi:hypothetical protein